MTAGGSRREGVSRRGIVSRTVSLLLVGIAGCQSPRSSADAESESLTPSERTASTTTPASSTTSTPVRDLSSLLPVATDGWTRTGTGEPAIGGLGAVDGVEADYESPDGTFYRVDVVRWDSREEARQESRWWVRVGWSVVVPYQWYTFAAGSGTPERTLTPEHPPQMPTTPVDGGAPAARELLALSPVLTAEYVRENETRTP